MSRGLGDVYKRQTLLSLGAVAAGTWCRTQVVSGFCADLRTAVFGRVNALTFEEVSRIGTSALLTRSTHDVGTLAWVADMLSSNIITIPVLFFGGVCCAVVFGGGAQKKLKALMHEQMGDFFRFAGAGDGLRLCCSCGQRGPARS